MNKRLIAITGPTCGGKTTLKEELLSGREALFRNVLTTTTRSPRMGEVDSVDYRFVNKSGFKRLIQRGELLEWVMVDSRYYGIERRSVAEACLGPTHGVVVVNPLGLSPLEQWCEENGVKLLRVFASAPIDELRRRLSARKGLASYEEIQSRGARLEDEALNCERQAAYDLYVGENHQKGIDQTLRAIQ